VKSLFRSLAQSARYPYHGSHTQELTRKITHARTCDIAIFDSLHHALRELRKRISWTFPIARISRCP
jgi:hypothetical protein